MSRSWNSVTFFLSSACAIAFTALGSAQTNSCINPPLGPVQPPGTSAPAFVPNLPAAAATALAPSGLQSASVIPTPGLTCSSLCGTTGVRNAADASQTSPGSGESLNQSIPFPGAAAPKSARPAAVSASPAQLFFVHGVSREPSLSSLPFGESVQAYINTLCGASLVTPSSAPLPPELRRLESAAAVAANSFALLGSQDFVFFTLPGGSQLLAWVNVNSTTLFTAVRSADGTALKNSTQYPVGPNSQNVIAADFNGDGAYDLAVSDFGSLSDNSGGNVRIFLGKGDGTFTPGAVISTVVTPAAMHSGDFNGDGKMDLAVGEITGNAIDVLLGNGDGSFQTPIKLSIADIPNSIVVDDFNKDGKLDLAVANYDGMVSVFLGTGTGAFKAEAKYASGEGHATFIASADLNGDGNSDLIVANPDANAVAFLFGSGDGTFQAPYLFSSGAEAPDFGIALGPDGAVITSPDYLAGNVVATPVNAAGVPVAPRLYILNNSPAGIAAADLNGDKYPDIVAASGPISVLLRDPAGAFKPPVNYNLQSGAQAVAAAVGDMNGDGRNDVVTSSAVTTQSGAFTGAIDVVLGNGDGTLGRQNSYPMGGLPGGPVGVGSSGIVLGDFNGDKKIDVAAGFQSSPFAAKSGGISVLLGNGDGTLRPAVTYAGGSASVYSLAAADFNGDGKLDLAAGGGTDSLDGGVLMILLGNGDGSFQSAKTLTVGSPAGVPSAIAAGDINGDGKPDIVAAVSNAGSQASVVVLLGNGDGTFRQLAPVPTRVAGAAIALIDLNGDGHPDIVVGDCCGFSESVYLIGKGDGTFQAPQYFASGSSARAFAVTSWNNDGVPGLAIALKTGAVMPLSVISAPKTTGGSAVAQVTSAAGGVAALAPGSLASAFGADLANGQPNPTSLPWPTAFEGTSVSITDSTGAQYPALITYVSQAQVNFQIPENVAQGAASIAVKSGDGTVSSASTTLAAFAPALFTLNPSNLSAAVAICVSASGAQSPEYPYQTLNGAIVAQPLNLGACSQTILELYGTGIDAAGAAAAQVTIGGVAANVQYAGPQQAFPGLDQINIVIPQSLAGKGSVPITLSIGGATSNTVNVSIQ